MTDYSHTRFIVRVTLVSILCLGTALPAVAQQPAHPTPPDDQAAREALPVYPSLHIAGFGDVNFAAQNRNEGARGFTEGQFTLHMVSALSPRIAFFGELTFTPRARCRHRQPGGDGIQRRGRARHHPVRPERRAEGVVRALSHADQLVEHRVSPRPVAADVDQPARDGAVRRTIHSRPFRRRARGRRDAERRLEHQLPGRDRQRTRQRHQSRGRRRRQQRRRPPCCVNVFTKPDRALRSSGRRHRHIPIASRPSDGPTTTNGSSRATRCGSARIRRSSRKSQTSGTPRSATSLTTSSLAYYVQAAYRLPAPARLWKPYFRFEHIDIDANDVVFTGVPNLDGSIDRRALRHLDVCCIKTEGRIRRRVDGSAADERLVPQIAFTF